MNKNTERSEKTREFMIKQYQTYPKLQTEDIFKCIFQSAFGCEHLVSNEEAALEYIKREYAALSEMGLPLIEPLVEPLDGEYSRVYLSCLNDGVNPETLTKIFCLSAKKEPNGKILLEQKLQATRGLIAEGILPFDITDFDKRIDEWRTMGYPAVHHSEDFRRAYHPAYRVIANRYAYFLSVFARIDKLLTEGSAIVAIEGGSASGKTTLAGILQEVYDCNVFHMDDFFLRPEQRTPQRFAEVGGNVDRERFLDEVLQPLMKNETVCYRRFDCSGQTFSKPITVTPKKLTVIEGVYSMHPAFEKYYDLSIFLDVAPEYQKTRILKRNTPRHAKRFFEEWIPLENLYFSEMQVKSRSMVCIVVE